ncbi:MAG TPA: hypothetical protein VHE11_08070, partial [Steroidobacteraceae bacterium]|nr:hypothetical protein [Steroidobacteraceae bacterium]
MPLTVGFIAKLYTMASGVDGRHGVLPGTLMAGGGVSLYYYLRIIVAMTAVSFAPGTGRPGPTNPRAGARRFAVRPCRARGPGIAADRAGRLSCAASDVDPYHGLHGGS